MVGDQQAAFGGHDGEGVGHLGVELLELRREVVEAPFDGRPRRRRRRRARRRSTARRRRRASGRTTGGGRRRRRPRRTRAARCAVSGHGVERVVELRLEAAAVGDDEGGVAEQVARSRIDGSKEWASPPTGISVSTAKWSVQSMSVDDVGPDRCRRDDDRAASPSPAAADRRNPPRAHDGESTAARRQMRSILKMVECSPSYGQLQPSPPDRARDDRGPRRVRALRQHRGPGAELADDPPRPVGGARRAQRQRQEHAAARPRRPAATDVGQRRAAAVTCASSFVAQHQLQHRWMPISVGEVLRMGRYGERGLLGRLGAADRRAIAEAAERMDVAGDGAPAVRRAVGWSAPARARRPGARRPPRPAAPRRADHRARPAVAATHPRPDRRRDGGGDDGRAVDAPPRRGSPAPTASSCSPGAWWRTGRRTRCCGRRCWPRRSATG